MPRDAFQDLYLKLKDRHRHLESRKPNPKARIAKEEDVKRHVYKVSHHCTTLLNPLAGCIALPSLVQPDPACSSEKHKVTIQVDPYRRQLTTRPTSSFLLAYIIPQLAPFVT